MKYRNYEERERERKNNDAVLVNETRDNYQCITLVMLRIYKRSSIIIIIFKKERKEI